jgi:hypothetical protein
LGANWGEMCASFSGLTKCTLRIEKLKVRVLDVGVQFVDNRVGEMWCQTGTSIEYRKHTVQSDTQKPGTQRRRRIRALLYSANRGGDDLGDHGYQLQSSHSLL